MNSQAGMADRNAADILRSLQQKLSACMQCGTCTASCGSTESMDLAPRELWRLVQFGMKEEIFKSKSFWLCTSCYTCTLRCPRGLPLTEAMSSLKHLAASEGILRDRMSPLFYRSFINNVRLYGRVREMELMGRFFLSLRSPLIPFTFIPLGAKLCSRNKISLHFPKFPGRGKLDALFDKACELEASAGA
jgi:heterodisulfide reductase subunit C2